MITSAPTERPQGKLGELEVRLRTPVPRRLEVGRASALFVHGAALSGTGRPADVELVVNGRGVRALAEQMPSPGLAAELGVGGAASSRAIFWGFVPLGPGSTRLAVSATLPGGGRHRVELGTVEPRPPAGPAEAGVVTDPARTVAICMATHDPPPELFRRQVESLLAQTHRDWICLISDDASGPEGLATLRDAVGADPRFVVSRSSRRVGAYENFHRALAMVPAEVAHVALSDQDDRWYPDKLEALIAGLGDANLVFSDMRVTRSDGAILAETYWSRRLPNHGNFASLLLGNSVTGAASLFRRRLLDDVLPFPPRVGNLYHDHWIALVARALGRIAYVPRPLYDYVQHPEAALGHDAANRGVVGGGPVRRLLALRGGLPGKLRSSWRRLYFAEYCRLIASATVLEARFRDRAGRSERRALTLALRGDGSPLTAAWLAARQLRRLWRDETLGSEAALLRAFAWRAGLRLRRGRAADPYDDADLPAGIVDPVEALDRDRTPESSRDPSTPGPGLQAP